MFQSDFNAIFCCPETLQEWLIRRAFGMLNAGFSLSGILTEAKSLNHKPGRADARVSSLTASEHEESREGSRGAGMWMLSAPALWRPRLGFH